MGNNYRWVTGTVYYYTRGHLAAGGLPPNLFHASIVIKFQAVDTTTGSKVEKIILSKSAPWTDEGTWRTDTMDIPLYQGRLYKFYFYAEVHSDALGLGAAVADFGGIWLSDSRIEWGYISIPNVESNLPPLTPSTPSGPTSGYTGTSYTYSTSTADPDGDDVRYQFNWADGTTYLTGWYTSGANASASHYWTSTGTKYVKVRAQDSTYAWSDWSPSLAVSISSGGGGGCPYVSTWDGAGWRVDNNLIPAAEYSNGSDVTDYYLLQQPLVRDEGKYSLLIWEPDKHSFLDQAQLMAVDHEPDENVAVSPDGEILTYRDPSPTMKAFNEAGENVSDLLWASDGQSYQGYAGDYILLDFEGADIRDGAKLVIRSDFPVLKSPIYIQTLNSSGAWQTISTIYTRRYWAIDIIDLSEHLPDVNGELKVRIAFTSTDKIDFIGLDTSKQGEIEIHYANLASAVHSNGTDMKEALTQSDNLYVELFPDEAIKLEFTLPQSTEDQRDFIIILEGRYFPIS